MAGGRRARARRTTIVADDEPDGSATTTPASGEPPARPALAAPGRPAHRAPPGALGRRRRGRPSASCGSSSRRLTLVVTTVVMMNVVHLNPLNPGADLVFDHTTPTGGDMGAHVWGPAFLRDHLLPNLQLRGWSMDWYAGMPVYRFYMVVPALAIVALDTSCRTAWRSSWSPSPGWSRCRCAAGRSAASPASATRCPSCSPSPGCASRSTRASASTAATSSRRWPASSRSRSPSASMILGLGLLADGMRTGKLPQLGGDRAGAGRSSATASSPSTPSSPRSSSCSSTSTACSGFLYGARRRRGDVLLSAFWIGPFLGNHEYMTDMKYGARPEGASDSFWDMFFPLTAPLDILVTDAGGDRVRRPASPAATPTAPRSASSGCSPSPSCTSRRTACRSSGCCGTRACCRCSTSCATC